MKICFHCGKDYSDITFTCHHCGYAPKNVLGFPLYAPDLAFDNKGFDPEVHEQFFRHEQGHFWFENRNALFEFVLGKYFPMIQNFYEIGCGTGFVLAGIAARYPDLEVSGSDIYVNTLQLVSKRIPKAVLFQADACHLPFKEHFDVVGIFDVLEHIEDDKCAIANIYQSVKKGGGCIISVPQHKWLWSSHDDFAYHKRRYTRNELITKLQEAGFQIEWVTSFISFLLPLMILMRLKNKLISRKIKNLDEHVEYNIPTSINSLLFNICRLEQFFLKRGFSLPWGGSLLCVARKV
jgi:SAM-dependent methyltransferase